MFINNLFFFLATFETGKANSRLNKKFKQHSIMKIIAANHEHLSIINKIAHTTWYNTYSEILSEEQIKYMLEWMYSLDSLKQQTEKENHHFLLIEEEGKYLGFVSYEIGYQKLPKTKIHKLYILPEQQGKGIGRHLIDEVSKIANNNNQ